MPPSARQKHAYPSLAYRPLRARAVRIAAASIPALSAATITHFATVVAVQNKYYRSKALCWSFQLSHLWSSLNAFNAFTTFNTLNTFNIFNLLIHLKPLKTE